MALLISCKFCGGDTLNHDHDECAEKFGSGVKRRILDHAIKFPETPLPTTIVDDLKSDRWKWYLQYLEREQKAEDTRRHIDTMQKKITEEAKKILNSNSSLKRLEKFRTKFNHRDFTVKVTPTVSVTIVPVY